MMCLKIYANSYRDCCSSVSMRRRSHFYTRGSILFGLPTSCQTCRRPFSRCHLHCSKLHVMSNSPNSCRVRVELLNILARRMRHSLRLVFLARFTTNRCPRLHSASVTLSTPPAVSLKTPLTSPCLYICLVTNHITVDGKIARNALSHCFHVFQISRLLRD